MTKPLRVLLMEETPGLLDDVGQWLLVQAEIQLIGRALPGQEAVAAAAALAPDLVLMDWDSGLAGVDALQLLKALPQAPRVIVLAAPDHPHFHAAVRAVGAEASSPRGAFRTGLLLLLQQMEGQTTNGRKKPRE
jgi:two-component system chemotaxis response regulator CheB